MPLIPDKKETSEAIANAFEFESETDLKEAARGTIHQLANYEGDDGTWLRVSDVAAAVKELREKIVQLLPTGMLYPEKYVRKNDVLALIDAVFGKEATKR